jgi:phosphatidylglycerophosphatase A
MIALAIFVLLSNSPTGLVVVWGALMAAGTWAASEAERVFARPDDGRIVIDEIAGQLFATSALLLLPPASRTKLLGLVTGFVAFRLFDIAKPGPVRWAERRFSGGLGVMLDDVVAGGMAAVVVGALVAGGVIA